MPINVGKTSPANQDWFAEIENILLAKQNDPDLVRAYHDRAVAAGQDSRARKTFDALQARFPNDHQIRSLNIALCLMQQDYPAAMKEIETLMSVGTPEDDLIDAALDVRAKLGPMAIANSQRMKSTISVCMIVKDEIANIGACLNNVKALADEIVVVDTGSRDRSADVANAYGARTFTYTWNEDFAAARNYSLDQAKGKWILILDADEMIASKDHDSLRRQINAYADHPAALSITTRNYTHLANAFQSRANDGSYPEHETGMGWVPSQKVRVFPHMACIRFRYPVHEKVDPAIREAGLPIVDCPTPVHHYGDLNVAKKQKKAETYFKLGYAKLNQLDNDLAAIRELAVQAGQLEYWNEAIALWQQLLEVRPNWAEAYVNMSGAYWRMARYEKSLDMALQAKDLDSDLKEARYNVAISLLFIGRISEAAEILKRIANDHPDYLAAHFMLAATYGCMGDEERSVEKFQILEKTQVGKTLSEAIENLVQRMHQAGLDKYAQRLLTQFNRQDIVNSDFAHILLSNFFLKIHNIEKNNWDYLRFENHEKRKDLFDVPKALNNFRFILSNLSDLELMYNQFHDEYSKSLFVKLLLFKVLGHIHIRLPLNTDQFWKNYCSIDSRYLVDKATAKHGKRVLNTYFIPTSGIKLNGTPLTILTIFDYKQYFYERNELIRPEKGDIVIDAGACRGDVALHFAHAVGENGQVHAFEFVPDNISFFQKNMKMNPVLNKRITLIQKALSDQSGKKLYYEDRGPSTALSVDSKFGASASTISIDNYVESSNLTTVDFIKMDIEGSEEKALKGACATIKRFKPKLSICIYHKQDDFIKIPSIIKEINPSYMFFLDHYTIHEEETILYAIEKSREAQDYTDAKRLLS